MPIHQTTTLLSQIHHLPWSSPNGPDQTQRHIRLACTIDNQGNKKIPWILQFLQEIHQRLCQNRFTNQPIGKEEYEIHLDGGSTESIRQAEEEIWRKTHPYHSRSNKTIRNICWHIKLCNRSSIHTKRQQWSATSLLFLFETTITSRKTLSHLRARISCNHPSYSRMETLYQWSTRRNRHLDWPQQHYPLDQPSQTITTNDKMVDNTQCLQNQN